MRELELRGISKNFGAIVALNGVDLNIDEGEMSIIVADTLPMQMEQLADGLSAVRVGQRPFEMGYKSMFIMQRYHRW